MCRPNLKSVALPVPGTIAIEVLGGVAKKRPEAVGNGTVRKSIGEFL